MFVRTPRRGARAALAATCVAALTSGVGLAAAPASATPPAQDDGVVAGAWIVTLKDGQSPDRVADEHRRNEGAQVDHVYRHAVRGYAARMSDTAAARVARDSRVASVEPDRVMSIAKPAAKPGGGGTTTQPPAPQKVPEGVLRIGTMGSTTAAIDGSANAVDVDVAVIDTGIDTDHPDLDVRPGVNCIRSGSTDDGNGHGTHVAGTIGARDNTEGVVGVAPGARLWAVRVLDNRGSGTSSSVMCGVDWVAKNASVIDVANMSLGGGGSEPAGTGCSTGNAYHDAVCSAVAAGVTFVVAAGNSAADAKGYVPAAFDEVITVSALADSDGVSGGSWPSTACRVDQEESLADFSNYGADVDLIAPGVCIQSTWKDGGYNTISGTSMASPHVAGAAALYKATTPGATPAQVRAHLESVGTTDWTRNPKDPAGSLSLPMEKLLHVSGL